jgi:hypothetical protein
LRQQNRDQLTIGEPGNGCEDCGATIIIGLFWRTRNMPKKRPRNEHRGAIVTFRCRLLQQADEKKSRPRRRYATRRSSFTSTSLQEVQDMTIKGGRPSGRGTVRTSFIMPPQEGQRRIARLSAKTMGANPKNERAGV